MTPTLPPGLAARFLVQQKLGGGAFGAVVAAVDRDLRRRVAIKLLNRLEPEAKARFFREAKLTANLRHPNLAQVFDHGEEAGQAFIVYELVQGRSLRSVMKQQGKLSQADIKRWGVELAGALSVAHASDVVHRDIKPANIMIRNDNAAVLVDFGMATAPDGEALTRTGQSVGSPKYMPPETLAYGISNAQSDQYALALTLTSAATGKVYDYAFKALMKNEGKTQFPNPPPPWMLPLAKALAWEPKNRFSDIGELGEALAESVSPQDPQWAWSRLLPQLSPQNLSEQTLENPAISHSSKAVKAPTPLPPPASAPSSFPRRLVPVLLLIGLGLGSGWLIGRLRNPQGLAPRRADSNAPPSTPVVSKVEESAYEALLQASFKLSEKKHDPDHFPRPIFPRRLGNRVTVLQDLRTPLAFRRFLKHWVRWVSVKKDTSVESLLETEAIQRGLQFISEVGALNRMTDSPLEWGPYSQDARASADFLKKTQDRLKEYKEELSKALQDLLRGTSENKRGPVFLGVLFARKTGTEGLNRLLERLLQQPAPQTPYERRILAYGLSSRTLAVKCSLQREWLQHFSETKEATHWPPHFLHELVDVSNRALSTCAHENASLAIPLAESALEIAERNPRRLDLNPTRGSFSAFRHRLRQSNVYQPLAHELLIDRIKTWLKAHPEVP